MDLLTLGAVKIPFPKQFLTDFGVAYTLKLVK